MTVKEHYDNHLGNFYSWYMGDFETNKEDFKKLCIENSIKPFDTKNAIDLGAGNGIQSIALAELGFRVRAIDFNRQLIEELKSRIENFPVEVINDDLRFVGKYSKPQPEVIVCCGDTVSHLESISEIRKLIQDSFNILSPKGKLILTFRDYSSELKDTNRFIPVKSDAQKILTCFIEYFSDKLRVTDLLYEYENSKWIQKVSSYFKTRIARESVIKFCEETGFKINHDHLANRMITIIGEKK